MSNYITSSLRRVPTEPGAELSLLRKRPDPPHSVSFSASQWALLARLTDLIIPSCSECGGALEAGAPQFIDLVVTDMPRYRTMFRGGLAWLDATCTERFNRPFMECDVAEQHVILCGLSAQQPDPIDQPGVAFFRLLRKFTVDAFVTSPEGIAYLQFVGNTHRAGFDGCAVVGEGDPR